MPFSNNSGMNRAAKDKVMKAVQTGFSTYKTGKNSGRKRATRDEDPNPTLVYDSFYELWALLLEDGKGVDFFEDEACTKPAGQSRYERFDSEATGEFRQSGTHVITAGPKAGAKVTTLSELVLSPEYLYIFEFSGSIPGAASYSTSGRWNSNGGRYKSYVKDLDGVVRRYECYYNKDGTSMLMFTDENGLEFTLNYNADQSGKGTITGDDTSVLPATIIWDETGSGTITFKDGTVETFENFQFRRS